MPKTLTRRAFGTTLLAGLGAAALPVRAAAQTKKLRIGCTTLIWGAVPRNPENLQPALKDMSDLGYWGFETFASILEESRKTGTRAALLERYPSPLPSADTRVTLTDPSTRKHQSEMLQNHARIV